MTLNDIWRVVVFEKESIILACLIALPTGFLFAVGEDLFRLGKPHIIAQWKRIVSKLRSKQA